MPIPPPALITAGPPISECANTGLHKLPLLSSPCPNWHHSYKSSCLGKWQEGEGGGRENKFHAHRFGEPGDLTYFNSACFSGPEKLHPSLHIWPKGYLTPIHRDTPIVRALLKRGPLVSQTWKLIEKQRACVAWRRGFLSMLSNFCFKDHWKICGPLKYRFLGTVLPKASQLWESE